MTTADSILSVPRLLKAVICTTWKLVRNGVPCSGNRWLLSDLLRGLLGDSRSPFVVTSSQTASDI